MQKDAFKIDIEKVIQDKAKDKAKYIPSLLVKWLKHIIHQDEINDFLTANEDKIGMPFLEACVQYLDMTLDVRGEEFLPSPNDGKQYTFASNHPLGGPDGVALGYILGTRYNGNIRYLVNDVLMNLKGLAPLLVGINKFGSQTRNFADCVENAFHSPNNIIIFPADLCSRKIKGIIQDVPWKKAFITKSVENHRDIIPVHFGGRNSNFFYNLANFCKMTGMKFNLAMLFLVDEMYKNRHKTFTVTFGKPIPWQTFTKERKPIEWAQYVRSIVYSLQ